MVLPSIQLATNHRIVHPSQSQTGQPAFEDEFLNRILGSQLQAYIDPEDQEILKELRGAPSNSPTMLNVGQEELCRHFQSDFGDRFWAMAQSGTKENLDATNQQRDAIQQWLSQTPNSLHQDGGIQRFAAILFSLPGTVRQLIPMQPSCMVRRWLQALLLYGH